MSKVWNKIQTHNLVYGGTFEDAKTSIRAKVFGYMVELANGRIEYYRSDLYHDALWLDININGAMQFDWIARESGTHIGDVVMHVKDDDCVKGARYRFDIRVEDDRKWMLDIYESVEAGDWREEIPGTGINYYGQPVTEVIKTVERTELVDEIMDLLVPTQSWADSHAALDISECDMAKAIEGCIFHPAPVGGWTECTGYYDNGTLQHDGDTCPSHENPTPRNNSLRKEMKMDDIIRDLREKFSEADSAKDQLEEYQSNISDAVDELETYLSDLDDLINSLDSLPEINLYVDLDTVSFDS